MLIEVEDVAPLEFADGSPVRAASAVARLGDGWLVAQDDANHAAWWRGGEVEAVRVFDPIEGHDTFDEASGTKHLKPDLEAACEVRVDGRPAVLLLGSGSSPARMRAGVVTLSDGRPHVTVADLTPVYAAVAAALEVTSDQLNLEGACVVGSMLRWFHRGLPAAGLPTRSVDLDVEEVLGALRDRVDPGRISVRDAHSYDLGAVAGVGLAATDVVSLSERAGTLLVSTAAEDSPNPRDDGPVVGSALAVLEGSRVSSGAPLPLLDGRVCKVEGLALLASSERSARLLATVDADDAGTASVALRLAVHW